MARLSSSFISDLRSSQEPKPDSALLRSTSYGPDYLDSILERQQRTAKRFKADRFDADLAQQRKLAEIQDKMFNEAKKKEEEINFAKSQNLNTLIQAALARQGSLEGVGAAFSGIAETQRLQQTNAKTLQDLYTKGEGTSYGYVPGKYFKDSGSGAVKPPSSAGGEGYQYGTYDDRNTVDAESQLQLLKTLLNR